MAGIFRVGEEKIRPGNYFRITTNDKSEAEVINGITAVRMKTMRMYLVLGGQPARLEKHLAAAP